MPNACDGVQAHVARRRVRDPTSGGHHYMSLRTHYKLLGAAGAAALAIGAMAGPAMAAGSTASISYTCTTPLGVNATPSAVYSVKQAPVTMAVGQPLSTTAVFTLDAGTTTLAQTALKWASFTGT